MTSLDTYLRGTHREDLAFLDKLNETIKEVLPVMYERINEIPLSQHDSTKVASWPYAVADKVVDPGSTGKSYFSASTHCMILFALDAFRRRGGDKFSLLLGSGFRPGALPDSMNADLRRVIDRASKALVGVLTDRAQPIVESSTYGNNDPFTLTWLAELAFRSEAKEFDGCIRKICEAVDPLLHDDRWEQILDASSVKGGFSQETGSFLKVRRLHLAKAIERLAEEAKLDSKAKAWLKKPKLWQDFDTTLHRQLAFAAVKDAKFDPAELAFAFEGVLHLHPLWIGRSTGDQVFEALRLSPDRLPPWRPITPFLTNDRGQVLFLVSIEVANSILRSCEILDSDDPVPTRFARFEPHLRSYASWLLGDVEQFPAPRHGGKKGKAGSKLVGWHTEYSDTRGTIHLWYTSHVLLFLAHYASFLRRKIAADGIAAAGLHLRLPRTIKLFEDYWKDEPLHTLATESKKHYAVHAAIEEQYIKPRERPEAISDTPRSILLYGPPGTGKTTLAEQMAVRLNRPLIVVTVSDFLAAGAAELENRAKGVFDVLRSQEEVVILFDEIDQFLLDRNSVFYTEQDDVFKFMTPGMLTKLQDLRDSEGCIFIIATNYYERIDSAIKRRGRIDDQFLLCLPDLEQRVTLMLRFAGKPEKREHNDAEFQSIVKIAKETPLYGYSDLKSLIKSGLITKLHPAAGTPPAKFDDAVKEAKGKVESAVNLRAYRNRFRRGDEFAFEEFFLLLYLYAESEKDLKIGEETILLALGKITGFKGDNLERLQELGYIKESKVLELLKTRLEPFCKDWKERKRKREQQKSHEQTDNEEKPKSRTTKPPAT